MAVVQSYVLRARIDTSPLDNKQLWSAEGLGSEELLYTLPRGTMVDVIQLSPDWYQLICTSHDLAQEDFPDCLYRLPLHASLLKDIDDDHDGSAPAGPYILGDLVFVPYRVATPDMVRWAYLSITEFDHPRGYEPSYQHMLEVCTIKGHQAGVILKLDAYQRIITADSVRDALNASIPVMPEQLRWDWHANWDELMFGNQQVLRIYRGHERGWRVEFTQVRLSGGSTAIGRDGQNLSFSAPSRKKAKVLAEKLIALYHYGVHKKPLTDKD